MSADIAFWSAIATIGATLAGAASAIAAFQSVAATRASVKVAADIERRSLERELYAAANALEVDIARVLAMAHEAGIQVKFTASIAGADNNSSQQQLEEEISKSRAEAQKHQDSLKAILPNFSGLAGCSPSDLLRKRADIAVMAGRVLIAYETVRGIRDRSVRLDWQIRLTKQLLELRPPK
jgi:hypothetical protein